MTIPAIDPVASTVQFIVAADGARREARQLTDAAQWLWFRPDVIPALLRFRHAALEWYSRDTGGVGCLPMSPVHFGLNDVGLVVVFAKDIATLPEWQQRIWAGFNLVPDGGIGAELHASQVRADPAETVAAEAELAEALARLAGTSVARLGVSILLCLPYRPPRPPNRESKAQSPLDDRTPGFLGWLGTSKTIPGRRRCSAGAADPQPRCPASTHGNAQGRDCAAVIERLREYLTGAIRPAVRRDCSTLSVFAGGRRRRGIWDGAAKRFQIRRLQRSDIYVWTVKSNTTIIPGQTGDSYGDSLGRAEACEVTTPPDSVRSPAACLRSRRSSPRGRYSTAGTLGVFRG
jgi:hypothetical protein